jgi:hypothetical protein
MTFLGELWLPVILSSVIVFIISSIIHMSPLWHKNDFPKVPYEDKIMDAMRQFNIPQGEYLIPRAANTKEMRSTEFMEKIKKGPVMIITIRPNSLPQMAKNLIQWFLYSVVVGIFSGYVAWHTLPVGADYLEVFRVVGTIAFLAYSLALWQISIWYWRSWSLTIKDTIDGIIYALLTAGTFGWLWPH